MLELQNPKYGIWLGLTRNGAPGERKDSDQKERLKMEHRSVLQALPISYGKLKLWDSGKRLGVNFLVVYVPYGFLISELCVQT
jgi:hypothetical protein